MEPVRKCVGCGGRFPKSQLVRIVKNSAGTISLDPAHKAEGRGAYVCPNEACIRLAVTRRQLNRAFRQNVPDSVYTKLEETVTDG